eukprot:IDg19437t1
MASCVFLSLLQSAALATPSSPAPRPRQMPALAPAAKISCRDAGRTRVALSVDECFVVPKLCVEQGIVKLQSAHADRRVPQARCAQCATSVSVKELCGALRCAQQVAGLLARWTLPARCSHWLTRTRYS